MEDETVANFSRASADIKGEGLVSIMIGLIDLLERKGVIDNHDLDDMLVHAASIHRRAAEASDPRDPHLKTATFIAWVRGKL